MATKTQIARWRRRAGTINRKAEELFEEIMDAESGEGSLVSGAHSAVIGSRELTAALMPDKSSDA